MDAEAVELKAPFLKNGNRSNPRSNLHVIPDFSGTICPQLGWNDSSDALRAIIFGGDGREFRRCDRVEDMAVIYNGVRDAILANIDATHARSAAAAKASRSGCAPPRLNRPLPPLPPPMVEAGEVAVAEMRTELRD